VQRPFQHCARHDKQRRYIFHSQTTEKEEESFPPFFFLPFPIVEDGRQGRPSCCPSRGKSSSSAWLNTF
jgi:hypothetical protein